MAQSKSSGKIARALKSLLLAVILVATSVATTMFLQGQLPGITASKEASTPEPAAIPEPLFTSLEPFTVTLRDSNGSRILYVGITLRVEDEASNKLLDTYMPEVRDRVLRTLTQQNTLEIQAPNGRERLADRLLQVLSEPYHAQLSGPHIARVLFTAYVVQ